MKMFLSVLIIGLTISIGRSSTILEVSNQMEQPKSPDDLNLNTLDSLIETLTKNPVTNLVLKNFIQSILNLEVLGCQEPTSDSELVEACLSAEGLNGAIDQWLEVARNDEKTFCTSKAFAMALNYFTQDAHDDVVGNHQLMYWTIYNAILPLIYTGSSVLDQIPNIIYDLVLNLSVCDKVDALKAIGSDAGYSKLMVTQKTNVLLESERQDFKCWSRKSCIIGAALVNIATEQITSQQAEKYKAVSGGFVTTVGVVNHLVHRTLDVA
ncbi:hypothetical protein ACFFRR_004121 [Megaselia abdita]